MLLPINLVGAGGHSTISKGLATWKLLTRHGETQTRSSVSGGRALGSSPRKYFSNEEKPRFVQQGQNLRDSLYSGKGDSQVPTTSQYRTSNLEVGRLGLGFGPILKAKFMSLSKLQAGSYGKGDKQPCFTWLL